ncbi:DNA internalization-related competence protein ComEC/Rec2 [Cohnella soli]|uniref:DNA internalization-related competence protein ComEC/Rec2 n=1 Tax=Cohnella soli TaxID=425005 RepID=A0ABW0HX91_9BACL
MINRRPLVAVACCWIVGTSLPSLWQGTQAFVALFAILVAVMALAVSRSASPKLVLLCVVAVVLAFGERIATDTRDGLVGGELNAELRKASDGKATVLRGTILLPAEVDGDLASFRLRVARSNIDAIQSETILVRVKLARQEEQLVASSWRRGDVVSVNGVLTLPGTAGNFGDFDYRDYLRGQGIHWQFNVKGAESVENTGTAPSWQHLPGRWLDDFRDRISAIMDKLYPRGDAGYMKGLVAGFRSDLDPKQYDGFAKLGLTHVLAISGLHVGVIVYMLLQGAALVGLTREKALGVAIAAMPAYMLITGASPSAVRACLMAMLALWLARRNALKDGLHLLMSAAMVMLVWKPAYIEDVSFQLSFLVTAGLIVFAPTMTSALPISRPWLRGSIAVALTAQIVSFPVTIYYFHAVHLLSLPANFVLVPFISFVVMPLGMASVVLGGLWLPLGIIPAKLATLGNGLTFVIIDWLNRIDGLRTVWPQPSLLWVGAAYILMGFGIWLVQRAKKRAEEREWWQDRREEAASEDNTVPLPVFDSSPDKRQRRQTIALVFVYMCAVFSWLIWGIQPDRLDSRATVSFLNVGQGDSVLIRTGGGRTIMVDAGGTVQFRKPGEEWRNRASPYEVGRKLLVPLLLRRGIDRIDALVLTHLDADHIGGAKAIMENVTVGALFYNGTIKNSPQTTELFRLAERKRIPSYAVHASMAWDLDESTKINVLYPGEEQAEDEVATIENNQNERSVTLLVTIYGRLFLLPGDLEAEGERAVVEAELRRDAGPRAPVDVLKAGHHGSRTSSTAQWIAYWHPRETVVSVGAKNTYGHPNGEVLERLASMGSRIWRTDLNGEIRYRISPDGAMERQTLTAGDKD